MCNLKNMKTKCLVVFNDENYILFLNGNKIENLLESMSRKKELYRLTNLDNKSFDFLIFDKDFNTYVHLDEETIIENLSKVLIRSKNDSNFLNLNYKFSSSNMCRLPNEDTNESIVVSVNPNDLNSANNLSRSNNSSSNNLFQNKESFEDKNNLLMIENASRTNNESNQNLNNQTETINNEFNDDSSYDKKMDTELEFEWTEDDVFCLLECCKQFIQEFAYFNISVDLTALNADEFYPNEELWEQIALKVRKYTCKSYNKYHCKAKFLKLRITYMNLMAYSSIENTYFSQLKYFEQLKQLIDGLKPALDSIHLKSRTKNSCKDRGKDKNVSSSYLALIQQVKNYSREFSGQKHIVWKEIADNLNSQGHTFTGKSCQGLFHRLRYTYLHLLKTVSSEDEGRSRWPYFIFFQDIDLTPFTSRRNESKRRSRKIKSLINTKTDEDVGDEEFEENDDDFENYVNYEDHLDPNDSTFNFENPTKKIKN